MLTGLNDGVSQDITWTKKKPTWTNADFSLVNMDYMDLAVQCPRKDIKLNHAPTSHWWGSGAFTWEKLHSDVTMTS